MYNKSFLILFFICVSIYAHAQPNKLFFKDGTTEKRTNFYNKVINGINKTIALPFTEENDERWQSAFYNIGLVQYKSAAVNKKIDSAALVAPMQSNDFKKAFLNLINSNYPKKYILPVKVIFATSIDDAKLMAMAANYLLPTANASEIISMLAQTEKELVLNPDNAILFELSNLLKNANKKTVTPSIKTFFAKDYLPKHVLVFSFQRKDRNYAGLAMVRDTSGNFVKNDNGIYFNVGQLARSNSNMPGFISNGNTPQGFFKMNGFDTSSNYFIGPTPNIQLAMPHEYDGISIEGKMIDSIWSKEQYTNLLPINFRNHQPMFGTFYAGKAGRTEIISHGTTIDAAYYKGTPYFSYTPTAGCLCTKESWNAKTGFLDTSDQLQLYDAVKKAGGAKGYLIVIEIDDKKTPVTINDILPFLK
jgi:hypothetical protein